MLCSLHVILGIVTSVEVDECLRTVYFQYRGRLIRLEFVKYSSRMCKDYGLGLFDSS